MTDLMIRYNDINGFSEKQIAVEGKFTEDLYETIVPPKVNLDKFIKANKVVKMTGVVIDFSSIPVA